MTGFDPTALPAGLPVPADDGACDHLPGAAVPDLALPATDGTHVNLAARPARFTVVYCYPRTGTPGVEMPGGTAAWDAVPGARGCTPQGCAYRDLAADFARVGAEVFGLSTQPTADQREAAARLHLPFLLLSDEALAFAAALNLPTFAVAGATLLKRVTLVFRAGVVVWHQYPVFPPDADAGRVRDWLERSRP